MGTQTNADQIDSAELELLVAESLKRNGLVGASVAVMANGQLSECAAGVLNNNTVLQATPNSVFQIGSITKLFTATLVMQLVDEGLLSLDTTLAYAIPELDLADSSLLDSVTVRHLLTHTSGIEGDHFFDTGSNDDCVERFVLSCATLPQVHPVGEYFSYCNTGFVLLGRIVEKLRGKPWHRVLRERLIEPLGITSMGTEAEQAILDGAAVGHIDFGDGPVVSRFNLPRSNGPAGSTPFATARDLVAFAGAHLAGGKASDDVPILSQASVDAMASRQFELPELAAASGWGWGWMHFDHGNRSLIGHFGATMGQTSRLKIDPKTETVLSILTTGGSSGLESFFTELEAFVFGESGQQHVTDMATFDRSELDGYVGVYRRLALEFTVTAVNGELVLSAKGLKMPWSSAVSQTGSLRPVSESIFELDGPGPLASSPVSFDGFDESGRPGYITIGARMTPRI